LQPITHWSPSGRGGHVRAELAFRFRDEDWTGEAGKEVEKAAPGRWLLMGLGGIPCQTIKLVAMSGTPWTQAAALVYFLAQILAEVVNVSAV
jgi:hypothetical protein